MLQITLLTDTANIGFKSTGSPFEAVNAVTKSSTSICKLEEFFS